MSEKKRTICMVTNWYPDKENPYRGLFFKEQAFALEEHFDFIVIHYIEKRKIPFPLYAVRCLFDTAVKVEKINEEKNTVEYNVCAIYPLYMLIWDKIYDLYVKVINHGRVEGIGTYVSKQYMKTKKRVLEKVYKRHFYETFDVLYCISAQTESSTLQILSDISKKPYIVAEHAPFPWPGSCIKDVEWNAIGNANSFMAISYDKIRQVMLQNIRLKRIAYVGNMVDESQFVMHKKSNDEKTFIIVAAHSFYKNYPLFIEIFERLVEITDVTFRVMIVGYKANKGYSKDTDMFEQRIQNSKFADKVELIPEVSHKDMPEVYSRADAFIMTSIQEGMPVSALEAGCCGLPIFSTMCGGVEDYVDEKIGRIYKIVDSESFANGLKDYLEGKITFDSEYIRQYIIEHYGKDTFVNKMTKEINAVIDSNI